MLAGCTAVPYDPAADHLALQDRGHDGPFSSAPTPGGSASSLKSSVPLKAIVFSDEPPVQGENGPTHLRSATPTALRPEAALYERRASVDALMDGGDLPSPPPPPQPPSSCLQTVPVVMQMQALHLHHQPTVGASAAITYHQQELVSMHGVMINPARSCFSPTPPPPPAIVTTAPMSLTSAGTPQQVISAAGTSRQLPHYPPPVPLPKPTPLWTPSQQPSAAGSGSVSVTVVRERPASVYSTASTIAVATGGAGGPNGPAVVSSVPILRTFGAAAGAKRQNSFGS